MQRKQLQYQQQHPLDELAREGHLRHGGQLRVKVAAQAPERQVAACSQCDSKMFEHNDAVTYMCENEYSVEAKLAYG